MGQDYSLFDSIDFSFFVKVGIIGVSIALVIIVIIEFFKQPFEYPVIKHKIDLSGRKKPSYIDCIDQWIIDNQDYDILGNYNRVLNKWEEDCRIYLKMTLLWRRHKKRIYEEILEEVKDKKYNFFHFVFVRQQTRYRQTNYNKTSYQVDNVECVVKLTLLQMLEIDDELEEIDYEMTREKYNIKNQRKLMTRELREKIMKRDNYTCQKCGKYMPDEVGLHVDHIVAVKNGGKSVPSNLQVLCDKCNYRKGAKK